MTIVVSVEDSPLEQVTKQLNKLVEVIKIVELDGSASVNRELLLVKVRADAETRGQILDVVELFQAKVVDVSPDTVVVQADRQRRQAGRPAPPARALRHPRARPVRHGRHRPRPPLDLRAHPAPGRRTVTVAGGMNTRSAGCPIRLVSVATSTNRPKRPRSSRTTTQKERPPWPRCSTTTTPTSP